MSFIHTRPARGPRQRHVRRVAAALAAAVMAVVTAGCGLQAANQFVPAAKAGSVKPIKALKGAKLTVGSKEFTEQQVLGKMAVILMQVAGADVTDNTNIKGSNSARLALQKGSIDMYWEYTGTSYISYNKHTKPIADQQKLWRTVRDEDLKKNGVRWLPYAPLNDTYALAVRAKQAKKLGVTKISDIKKLPKSERTFCIESEFSGRDDGLPGMLKAYGMPLGSAVSRGNVQTMGVGVVYTATAKGACNFGEVFTTDGRVKGLNLSVLKDDKQFFPLYNAAMTVNEKTYQKYPQIAQVFAQVTKQLTNNDLAKLDAQVDVDGEDPAIVARDWLKQKGFVN